MDPRPKGKLAPLQEVPLYTPPVLQTTSLSNEGTAKRPNRLNPIEKLKPLNPEALTSASTPTPTPTPTRSKRLNPLVNRELTLKNSDQGLTDSLAVSSPHTSALNSSNDSMSLNSPTLSENEKYRRAVAYFKANPSVEKWRKSESGLGESWCHSKDGTVFKLTSHVVGKGSFGKVKYSEFEESVVKVCVLKKEKALQAIIKEAAIAQTLGIATSDLIIRRTTNALGESIIKTYQRMNYLGKSLEDTLKGEKASQSSNPTSAEQEKNFKTEINRAIELCLLIDKLHTGELSADQSPYLHRDIKPANLTIDGKGRMHLIDFGGAILNSATSGYSEIVGSPAYMAIDVKDIGDHWFAEECLHKENGSRYMNEDYQLNNILQDKIPVLRTIVHPVDRSELPSVLSQSSRQKLPEALASLLDTTEIAPHLSDLRHHETEKFFAAVLIAYRNNGYAITKEQINEIRHDEKQQSELVLQEKRSPPINFPTQAEIAELERQEMEEIDRALEAMGVMIAEGKNLTENEQRELLQNPSLVNEVLHRASQSPFLTAVIHAVRENDHCVNSDLFIPLRDHYNCDGSPKTSSSNICAVQEMKERLAALKAIDSTPTSLSEKTDDPTLSAHSIVRRN